MKAAIISALVAVAFAQQDERLDLDKGKSREEIGHQVVPGGTAPQIQQLKPRFQAYNKDVKRTKVRYGPYTLPSTKSTTLMSLISGEAGTMSTIAIGMKKPCDTCGLVTLQAALEFPNGTVADNPQGAWLHHVVMVASGTGRSDNVCGTWVLPGERFFSSGNERTPTAFGDVLGNKVKSVFPISPADTFLAQLELMSLDEREKPVYLVMDYEYVPGPRPADYKIAKAMWLDVTNCGISSVIPQKGKMQFTLNSRAWTSGFNGQLLGVGGHLHDGGMMVNVYQNDKVICKSTPKYAKTAGGHSHGRRSETHSLARRDGPEAADGKDHIKEMTTCSMMGGLTKGDKIRIDAVYDFNAHEGGKSKAGAYTEVMGIAILYAAADPPAPAAAAAPAASATPAAKSAKSA
ncbi:hypothetical protein BT63DRAFT_240512 [Microthyrium microscopicum]|uniref:Uncharacterized protein n=1 Tax=Microthyrium microscopicum TaxID=703497 RepID=A0A6A6UFF9_9PEZI|nr:hypothetical protein BT63DRAFT_240512 [Microthyrium microscopicum]